jgi:hypothetical protein
MEIFSDAYVPLEVREDIMESSQELDAAYEPLVNQKEISACGFGSSRIMHLD